MREIKFRAWDTDLKKMYLVVHPFSNFANQDVLGNTISFGYAQEWDDIYKLMQYTGLLDKNGVEIYESDLLKREFDDKEYHMRWVGSGFWLVGLWVGAKDIEPNAQELSESWEVVGNEYESR